MKQLVALFAVTALAALIGSSSAPGPVAASPAPGGGPTGAMGTIPDPMYGPGTHVIDLATTGTYDPVLWMVILDYEAFTVGAGAVVRFSNHSSRAPVVIRATGPIVIEGQVFLDGEPGRNYDLIPSTAQPGPGGFRAGPGGRWTTAPTDGFGPGGGFRNPGTPNNSRIAGSASHQTIGDVGLSVSAPTYGSPGAFALVGGSGGAGSRFNGLGAGGGAGGGAVLIGSDTSLQLRGGVFARGGARGNGTTWPQYEYGYGGAGSGGTVRLFAPQVSIDAAARIETTGGNSTLGGAGYIRVESDGDADVDGNAYFAPAPSWSATLGEFLPTALPEVAIVSVWDPEAMGGTGAWLPITDDPLAKLVPSTATDVQLAQTGSAIFKLGGRDVPLGAPLHVRTNHVRGQASIDSTHTMGESNGPNGEASTLSLSWTDVTIDLSEGVSAIQVRTELP